MSNALFFVSRQLETMDGDRSVVTVTLGIPQTAEGKWGCPLAIEGLGSPISHKVPGIDAMQALINALAVARKTLVDSGRSFKYAGIPGVGIPRILLDTFGDGFIEHLTAMVDAEEDRHRAELKTRAERQRAAAEGQ